MPEKVNFLKKYPLIPSIFFILFAWFCLHLITTCKENSQQISSNNLIINELAIKANNPDWELTISPQGLVFQTTQVGKVEFTYPSQIMLKNDQLGSVRIYETRNTQDEIQVTLIRQSLAPQERVIVKFRSKYYYYESSEQVLAP
jgi:hypothetical protein